MLRTDLLCEKYITEIPAGETVIWLLALQKISDECFAAMYECCDMGRKEKTDRIGPGLKKKQSIGAGYLLYVLKKKFSLTSEIRILPGGKPVFKDEKGICFSISHSGNWAALAYGRQPLGLDIEYVRAAREKVAQRFFTKEEYEEVIGKEGAERDSAFFRIWTGKEAIVKAAGAGLKIPPESFSVLSDPVGLLNKSYRLFQTETETDGERLWISAAREAEAPSFRNKTPSV